MDIQKSLTDWIEEKNAEVKNDNLEKEIQRKGDIIVRLLTVIAETGNQELIDKALLALK